MDEEIEQTIHLFDSEVDALNDVILLLKTYKENTSCSGRIKMSIVNNRKLILKCGQIKFELER